MSLLAIERITQPASRTNRTNVDCTHPIQTRYAPDCSAACECSLPCAKNSWKSSVDCAELITGRAPRFLVLVLLQSLASPARQVRNCPLWWHVIHTSKSPLYVQHALTCAGTTSPALQLPWRCSPPAPLFSPQQARNNALVRDTAVVPHIIVSRRLGHLAGSSRSALEIKITTISSGKTHLNYLFPCSPLFPMRRFGPCTRRLSPQTGAQRSIQSLDFAIRHLVAKAKSVLHPHTSSL